MFFHFCKCKGCACCVSDRQDSSESFCCSFRCAVCVVGRLGLKKWSTIFNTVVWWYVNSVIFWLHNGIHHILPYIANINHYHWKIDELLSIKEGYCLGNLINSGQQSKVWVLSLEKKQRHFIYVIQILLYGGIWLNNFIVWKVEKKYCIHDFYFLKKKTFLVLKN